MQDKNSNNRLPLTLRRGNPLLPPLNTQSFSLPELTDVEQGSASPQRKYGIGQLGLRYQSVSPASTPDSDTTSKPEYFPSRERRMGMPSPLILTEKEDTWERTESNASDNDLPAHNETFKEKLEYRRINCLAYLESYLPSFLKRNDPSEYKLEILVTVLFIFIFSIVLYTHIHDINTEYEGITLQYIHINEKQKTLLLTGTDERNALNATLGKSIPSNAKPYPCMEENIKPEDDLCIVWMDHEIQARLHIRSMQISGLHCHQLVWKSLRNDLYPTDCLEVHTSHWWGFGDMMAADSVKMAPFLKGKGDWGWITHREVFTQNGVSVNVDPNVPLQMSIDSSGSPRICLRGGHRDTYRDTRYAMPRLNYTLCRAANARELAIHSRMLLNTERKRCIAKPKTSDIKGEQMFSSTLIYYGRETDEKFSVESLANLTQTILQERVTKPGYIIISEDWQARSGDLTFNKTSFPDATKHFNFLHRKGFRIYLEVSPYMFTGSKLYMKALNDGVLLLDAEGDSPRLFRYKGEPSFAILDFDKVVTKQWCEKILLKKAKQYGVDGFSLKPDDGHGNQFQYIPAIYRPCKLNKRPTLPLEARHLALLGDNLVSTAAMQPRNPTWQGLQSLIPAVCNVGLSGTDMIVGTGIRKVVDKELYIRWLQVSIFLPLFELSVFPMNYGKKVADYHRDTLMDIRHKFVIPEFLVYMNGSLPELPLIRPLSLSSSSVGDEDSPLNPHMMVGENILVAPVVQANQTFRDILLPPGQWKLRGEGDAVSGDRLLRKHRADLYQIIFYVRHNEKDESTVSR